MLNHDRMKPRKFERFLVDLEILIHSHDSSVKKLIETSIVNDISAGGISFTCKNPEQYVIGQQVCTSIHLPNYEVFNASVNSLATVIRIFQVKCDGDNITEDHIGLQVDGDLSFEDLSK
jgi:hypothetical protein